MTHELVSYLVFPGFNMKALTLHAGINPPNCRSFNTFMFVYLQMKILDSRSQMKTRITMKMNPRTRMKI